MKSITHLLIFTVFSLGIINAQVGIGTTTPDASSALDVTANDKGILVPRMLVAERIAISAPAEGLLIYQTDDVSGFYFYNGTQWVRLMDKSRDGVPIGAVFAFPSATLPMGYLSCDGSAVSRTTYAELFAVIGTTYGNGDGSTTFNLPDYRGEFLRGLDNGAGTDPDAATRTDRGDGAIGDVVGTKQTFENAMHLHQIDPPNSNVTASGIHNHYVNGYTANTNSTGNHTHNIYVNGGTNTGGNHYHQLYYREVDVATPGAFGGGTTIRELRPGTGTINTLGSGAHAHSVNATANMYSAGSHSHSLNVPSQYTQNTGSHQHSIDIAAFDSATEGGNESRPTNVNVIWCIKY
ncbi:phage tail protein [Psychroserpens sp. BH13MA-6]